MTIDNIYKGIKHVVKISTDISTSCEHCSANVTCPPKTSPGKMLDLGLIRKGASLWVEGRILLSRSSR